MVTVRVYVQPKKKEKKRKKCKTIELICDVVINERYIECRIDVGFFLRCYDCEGRGGGGRKKEEGNGRGIEEGRGSGKDTYE